MHGEVPSGGGASETRRAMRRTFVCLFLYILCLHGVAIFIFARGFLLTRTELPVSSCCNDTRQSPCLVHDESYATFLQSKDAVSNSSRTRPQPSCWTKPAVDRVVIIVLDALRNSKGIFWERFDFVAPSRIFEDTKPWMDKLSVLQKLAAEEGSGARIFKAIADPPTTSLQRLKGLTTGGLPTFIDVGNSFGAPAITEDNIIIQLIKHGRRVIMMGDDTWLQVFPSHFSEAHPFPSFNVKDLDTVDNGCIEHIFPALYRDDWDVLIAHFLGVDHAGHIFGVESPQMIGKLEQYNKILEEIVSVLKSHAGPGGLHENTLLIVMGDHGQTVNGDHGGGTPEEVETSLFAMSMHKHAGIISSRMDKLFCKDEGGDKGFSVISQLDFAATISALIGVPFPFGSIGRVNPELYILGAGALFELKMFSMDGMSDFSFKQSWLETFTNILCINSWQVKRYIDMYSASSMIGFSSNDLIELETIYHQAEKHFIDIKEKLSSLRDDFEDEPWRTPIPIMEKQIDLFTQYLKASAALARSKWTQFGLETMILGVSLSVISLFVQLAAFSAVEKLIVIYLAEKKLAIQQITALFPWKRLLLIGQFSALGGVICFPLICSLIKSVSIAQCIASAKQDWFVIVLVSYTLGSAVGFLSTSMDSLKVKNMLYFLKKKVLQYEQCLLTSMVPFIFIIVRACSFLSNSYILVEGRVVSFLLASTGIIYLKHAIQNEYMVSKALLCLILNFILDLTAQNTSKEALMDSTTGSFSLGIFAGGSIQLAITVLASITPVIILVVITSKWFQAKGFHFNRSFHHGAYIGAVFSYIFIFLHWFVSDINHEMSWDLPDNLIRATKLKLPHIVYLLTGGQAVYLFCKQISMPEIAFNFMSNMAEAVSGMLLVWSTSIILLLGKHGPFVAFLAALQAGCILDLQHLLHDSKMSDCANRKAIDLLPVVQWYFLATKMFFTTGHRCAFDGLRYGVAFIGFENFNIIRQGVLLALDTFGISHILPIFGLPLIVLSRHSHHQSPSEVIILKLVQVFLIYGLITALMTNLSTICVMIHRRHLMVWGLFAPKYVFEIVGLLLTDWLLVLISMYYL